MSSRGPGIEIQSEIIVELLGPYPPEDDATPECTVAELCRETDEAFTDQDVKKAVQFLANQRSGLDFDETPISDQTRVYVDDRDRAETYRDGLLPY